MTQKRPRTVPTLTPTARRSRRTKPVEPADNETLIAQAIEASKRGDWSKKWLQEFLTKNFLTMVPAEDMFVEHQQLPTRRLCDLATFNSRRAWITVDPRSGNAFNRALGEMAIHVSHDNVLNVAAEIDPAQVLYVLTNLLHYRRLVHPVEVTRLTDFPEALVSMYPERDFEKEQVYSGRHRSIALMLLYGPTQEIPIIFREMNYEMARISCFSSNDVRKLRKVEELAYTGIKDSVDPAGGFRRCGGNAKKIAIWSCSQLMQLVPGMSPLLKPVSRVRIVERLKGEAGITAVAFRGMLHYALSQIPKTAMNVFSFYKWSPQNVETINDLVDLFERLWLRIREIDPSRASTAWGAYTSLVFGSIIGGNYVAWRIGNISKDAYDVKSEIFIDNFATAILKLMDRRGSEYSRMPQRDVHEALQAVLQTEGLSLDGTPVEQPELIEPEML